MSTLKGKVKWFNGKKGYGFIEREDGEKDCFVHASSVREAGLRYLNEGDQLEFEIEDGDITKMAEIYWLDEWSKSTGRFYNDGRTLMRAMEAWNQLNADQAVQLER